MFGYDGKTPAPSVVVTGADGAYTFPVIPAGSYRIEIVTPPGYNGPMTYEALTKAGVPLFAYGNFITVAINFVILAFIIFVMVKQINRVRGETPAAPPPPPEDVVLLREIRDALKK